jgi:hypothetical protein
VHAEAEEPRHHRRRELVRLVRRHRSVSAQIRLHEAPPSSPLLSPPSR